jgi:putative ABC transport system ATP-binding protein
MIQLENIQRIYQTRSIETLALDNVNLHIKSGEFISIMGPSGCGKSTLLNIMGLLDKPNEGVLTLDGETINGHSDKQLARIRNEKLGFIFQSFHLINSLSVLDNVEIPLLYRKVSAKKRRARAQEVLEQVGLSHRLHHYPRELSGGQAQRVAIARALAGQPRVLLADEPTGNLDSKMGSEILDLLQQINRELGTTVVMVTHDRQMAEKTQHIIHLFDGRKVN